MLPLLARLDLGAMAMKGYSAFPKAPALLEPHHQIVYCHIQDTRLGGVLPLCREAVGVFYSPSRLGNCLLGCCFCYCCYCCFCCCGCCYCCYCYCCRDCYCRWSCYRRGRSSWDSGGLASFFYDLSLSLLPLRSTLVLVWGTILVTRAIPVVIIVVVVAGVIVVIV